MPLLLAIAISTGLLSGVWAVFSMTLGLITFAGFLGWSTYFAAGGGAKGLQTALATNFSGVLWGFLIVQMTDLFILVIGDALGLGLATAIGAGAMCLQSRWKPLGYIPGAFIGSSTFFATGNDLSGAISGLILGALLGFISEKGTALIRPTKTR
ncbi:DUF1097 domain-containing protein [Paenibacillus marinisediminis]